jgi:hypothetical protein
LEGREEGRKEGRKDKKEREGGENILCERC